MILLVRHFGILFPGIHIQKAEYIAARFGFGALVLSNCMDHPANARQVESLLPIICSACL